MSSFQPWANPDPQSVAGVNSAMVYGENIQVAVGLNHQVAVGSNLQLCVNPAALLDLLNVPGSATLSGMFGSGLGGNLQMTIGTNTAINWGRQFQINLGPEPVTINASTNKPFMIAMSSLIGAACIAYAIAYGLCGDEDGRATIVIVFQTTMDLLLAVFMAQQMFYKGLEQNLADGLRTLYAAPTPDHSTLGEDFLGALSFVGIMAAAVAPPVAIAVEEGHFQGEKQDFSQ